MAKNNQAEQLSANTGIEPLSNYGLDESISLAIH